eukprot:gene10241-8158_t
MQANNLTGDKALEAEGGFVDAAGDGLYGTSNRLRKVKMDSKESTGGMKAIDIVKAPPRKGTNQLVPWTAVLNKIFALSWPLSGMEVLTFTKELIITAYVGHLGPMELSSLVLALTIYNVTGNAPMLGMVVAMETFCGQAYGAKKYSTVGVVLQRALIIVTIFNFCTIAFWGYAEWLLVAMGQDPEIARGAGRLTMLLAPCLVMDVCGPALDDGHHGGHTYDTNVLVVLHHLL